MQNNDLNQIKTYAICFRRYDKACQTYAKKLTNIFKKSNFLNNKTPDLVIVIGGDGTFLTSVQTYGLDPLYLIINKGQIGYYGDFQEADAEHFFKKMFTKTFSNTEININSFSVLKINSANNKKCYFAVNEIKLISYFVPFEIDIEINNILYLNLLGSGITASTAAGSSGFNRSNLGPLLDPTAPNWILTPLNPVNNAKNRSLPNPIVLQLNDEINLKISPYRNKCYFITDLICQSKITVQQAFQIKLQFQALKIINLHPANTKTWIAKLQKIFV